MTVKLREKRYTPPRINSPYLYEMFDSHMRNDVVDKAIESIREFSKYNQFETIVVTGLSGASIGFIVSHLTGIPITVVRKKEARSHSNLNLEGLVNFRRYIILDDFCFSGDTIRRMVKEVNGYHIDEPELMGVYLYNGQNNSLNFQSENWPIIPGV